MQRSSRKRDEPIAGKRAIGFFVRIRERVCIILNQFLFRRTGKNGAVSCSSKKARYVKPGRSRVNTGVNFFPYSAFFDMMYDTHITELSVFLLVNLYLLIRYRNRLTYFLT